MPRRLSLPSSLCASVALVAGSVAFVAAPATAAPPSFEQCADVFPAAELETGQEVSGLTTAGRARGSEVEPEGFTGTFVDTLEGDDGDLLVFDLAGSRITKADGSIDAGVWSGMSGSPVYAADGRLVGAVSYTFGNFEASTIAGVTPAADMYALLDGGDVQAPPERIALSTKQTKQLVAAGASSRELGKGARRIAPVSAITLPEKFAAGYATIAKRAGAPSRDLATGGTTSTEAVPIVAGGNIAAADSYGSLASYALGTATAVCGNEVVGFGHPMDFVNAQRTIHGARTSFIQADGVGSFKMGNLTAPVGALTHDGLAGIVGRLARDVDATTITSTAARSGKAPTTYTSKVPNPDALAELAATHAFRDAVLAQDQMGGGESVVSWTVKGTSTETGAPITLTRGQRYSARADLAERVGNDLASDVATLQENEFATLDIDDVTIDDALSSTYKALKVGTIDRYDTASRTWKRVSTSKAIPAPRGKQLKLRINLVKADKYSKATPTSVISTLSVSRHAVGTGRLLIAGGDQPSWDDDEEYFFEDSAPWETDAFYFEDEEDDELTIPEKKPTSAEGVAALLSKQQHHDYLYVSHDYITGSVGLLNVDRKYRQASVVKGSVRLRVSYR